VGPDGYCVGVPFERYSDGAEPVRGERIGRLHEEQQRRTQVMAVGTLACPRCDAPISPGPRPLSPAEPLLCPFCLHDAAVRDFVSLSTPGRPAVIEVRISRTP
jgi:hypothetical protein